MRGTGAGTFSCKGYMLRIFEMLTPKLYSVLRTEDRQAFQLRLYERVLEYMSEHVRTVTLAELSGEFHFQKDYFNRLLKKNTGRSFREVRQRLRKILTNESELFGLTRKSA